MDNAMLVWREPSSAGFAAGAFAPQSRHSEQLAERGLCHYLTQIATGLAIGMEAAYWDIADSASAYLPLEARLHGVPHCDVALIWDGRRGWALGVEYGTGLELLVLGYLGESVLPAPQAVVDFAKRALAGAGQMRWYPPRLSVPDLSERLAAYAPSPAT